MGLLVIEHAPFAWLSNLITEGCFDFWVNGTCSLRVVHLRFLLFWIVCNFIKDAGCKRLQDWLYPPDCSGSKFQSYTWGDYPISRCIFIYMVVLKKISPELSLISEKLLNHCLREKCIPSLRKMSTVSPVFFFNAAERSSMPQYRAISFFIVIRKLVKSVINHKVVEQEQHPER